MDIALLGYFGQDNFGDEAINRSTMQFLLDEFGKDINIHLFNQASWTKNVTGKFQENCEGLLPFHVHEKWFDAISYKKFDLLAVCNMGFVNGFSKDVALESIDKDMPLRFYSIKQARPTGLRGEIFCKILDKSQFGIFRSQHEYDTYSPNINENIVLGMDLAFFIDVKEIDDDGYILISPRFFSVDEYNMQQIEIIKYISNKVEDKDILLFSCSKDDDFFLDKFQDLKNINPINFRHTDVISKCNYLARSSSVISLGRLHPLIMGVKYNKPVLHINNNFSNGIVDYMKNKVIYFCKDFNIPICRTEDSIDLLYSYINRENIVNNRIKNMSKFLRII